MCVCMCIYTCIVIVVISVVVVVVIVVVVVVMRVVYCHLLFMPVYNKMQQRDIKMCVCMYDG